MVEQSDKRIVLLTGATGGIGEAIVETLISNGDSVIAVGRNESKLQAIKDKHGEKVQSLAIDMKDGTAVDGILESLSQQWRQVDVLINNAGHDIGGRRLFHEGSADEWADILDTNVNGLMRMTRAVVPGMVTRGQGHIVNMGSVSGLFTYAGGTAYNASKFAVRAFTEALRKDYAETDIRVTEILPGMVRTGFAAQRLSDEDAGEAFYEEFLSCLEPVDVANAVLYALEQPPHVNISQVVIEPTRVGKKT